MSKILFIDIETAPAPLELKPLFISIYKREYIQDEEFERETQLDPNFGRIFCIAYAISPPVDSEIKILCGDEADIIKQFWEIQKDAMIIAGHNVSGFDIPFIWKRSILLNIKPPLSQRAVTSKIRDTQLMFLNIDMRPDRQPKRISLGNLATLLGLESHKQEIKGSDVYQLLKGNQIQQIYDYCKKDVMLTRQIYYRLSM